LKRSSATRLQKKVEPQRNSHKKGQKTQKDTGEIATGITYGYPVGALLEVPMYDYEILFVDDDKAILKMVENYLYREGYTVTAVDSGLKALDLLKDKRFDIVFTDFKMPQITGIELLSAIKEYRSETEVIIVTGHGTMETAIQAMKIGSYDYVQKPFKLEILKLIIDRIIEEKKIKEGNVRLKTRLKQRHRYEALVGISLPMLEIYEIIDQMKDSSPNVMIQGESGTGKQLCAKTIHQTSDRKDRPLIPVNCSSLLGRIPDKDLPERLLDAFHAADSGTLYLDEITAIPTKAQAEITRLLRHHTKRRADDRDKQIDVRIIAATNQDPFDFIEQDERTKKFYNLLNSVYIKMPALRARKEDICLLINHFLAKQRARHTHKIYNVSQAALDHLLSYNWPGNVIQLENVIERAFALGAQTLVEVDDLPKEIITFGAIARIGS